MYSWYAGVCDVGGTETTICPLRSPTVVATVAGFGLAPMRRTPTTIRTAIRSAAPQTGAARRRMNADLSGRDTGTMIMRTCLGEQRVLGT
jgi:hypothetical protein